MGPSTACSSPCDAARNSLPTTPKQCNAPQSSTRKHEVRGHLLPVRTDVDESLGVLPILEAKFVRSRPFGIERNLLHPLSQSSTPAPKRASRGTMLLIPRASSSRTLLRRHISSPVGLFTQAANLGFRLLPSFDTDKPIRTSTSVASSRSPGSKTSSLSSSATHSVCEHLTWRG